jgi:hypothetical protein
VAVLSVTLAIFFAMRDPADSAPRTAQAQSSPSALPPAEEGTERNTEVKVTTAPPAARAENTPVPQELIPEEIAPPAVPVAAPPRPVASRAVPSGRAPTPRTRGGDRPTQVSATTPARPSPDDSGSAGVGLPDDADARRRDYTPAARDPAKARALVARGQSAVTSGRWTQAEKDFRGAVDSDPENADALAGLAEAEFENARYPSALRNARAAVRRNPRLLKPHVVLGMTALKLGRYEEAVRAYEKALTIEPGNRGLQEDIEIARSRLAGNK